MAKAKLDRYPDKETLGKLYEQIGNMQALSRYLNIPYSSLRSYMVVRGIIPKTHGWKAPKTITHHGADHHNWKGGTTTSAHGYVFEYAPDHPKNSKGYVQQHRLVMERQLGRYLTAQEAVHHINGDKQDNRPENLVVLTRSAHQRHHKATAPRNDKGQFTG